MQSQIDALHEERSHLLLKLQEQSSQVSEGGIRLVGLSEEHHDVVRSFANRLCQGGAFMDANADSHKQLQQLTKAHEEALARIISMERE